MEKLRSIIMIWIVSQWEINIILKSAEGNEQKSNLIFCTGDFVGSRTHLYEERSGMYEFNSEKSIEIYITTKRIGDKLNPDASYPHHP